MGVLQKLMTSSYLGNNDDFSPRVPEPAVKYEIPLNY